MRVFVTGASGWIGSALVPELIGAGHRVTGLARSEAAASALARAGAEVVHGGLDDLDVLRAATAASDGVAHLAFKHDLAFTGDFPAAVRADRAALDVFAGALAGSDRPFVLASGLAGLKPGQVSTERDGHDVDPHDAALLDSGPLGRHANAELALSLAERGVRSSVLRLAPTVHGDGDHGFMATLVGIARDKGVSGYLGDGGVRWPAVHREDAARLFRLALEDAPAGSTLHAAAEEGVRLGDVAEAIGRRLGLPVAAVAPERAPEHFGWLAGFLGLDCPASSALTRELLGWEPKREGLLADLEQGHYFTA
ncbi:SDR family oxidoreductase [Streptomyces sp. NPDC001941]|uniref:SDR family oxidoreductase n=1 Tax=Streptomyces sp. NPDC001941 TaxID=3154659 RepID=UPI00332D71B4